jgi:HEAT repeat protein
MRCSRIAGLAALLTVCSLVVVRGQEKSSKPSTAKPAPADDMAALIKELTGETEAQKRSPEQLQAAYVKVIDSLLANMGSDDMGARGTAQGTLEKITHRAGRPGAEDERPALSKAIASKVGPDSPQKARVWMLRMLQHIGKEECVSVLAGLLGDKDAEVAESARRALQHNRSEQAGAALRAALDKADKPESRVAFINSLGNRKDAAVVGAIAKLLSDKDSSVVIAAARALGNIGGPDAGKALAGARAGAAAEVRPVVTDAYLLCADSLLADGKKAEAAAIYQEMYALAEPAKVRIAAMRGLLLAKPEGAVALLSEVITGNDAQLRAAATRFTSDVPGAEATKAFAALVPNLSPPVAGALLSELGVRGDPAAKPAVLEATKSAEESVRVAAIRALGSLGDSSDLPLLVKTASAGQAEGDAARQSIAVLRGQDVDQAMLKLLDGSETKVRVELLRGLAARRAESALPSIVKATEDKEVAVRGQAIQSLVEMLRGQGSPKIDSALPAVLKAADDNEASVRAQAVQAMVEILRGQSGASVESAVACLLKAADDKDGGVRLEAVAGLGALADQKVLPAMVNSLVKLADGAAKLPKERDQDKKAMEKEQQAAEKAMGSICGRAGNKDACAEQVLSGMSGAETPGKCALLRVLSSAGGAKALAAVRNGVKDAKPEVQDAAIRALSEWTEPAAAPDLLEIAKTAAKQNHQVLALRGYVRLAGIPQDRPAAEKMKMYQDAMGLAKRPDEKKTVLSAVGEVKTVEGFRMAAKHVEDKEIQEEACSAVVKIAKELVDKNVKDLDATARGEVSGALEKVSQISKGKKDEVTKILDKLKKAPPPASKPTDTKPPKPK